MTEEVWMWFFGSSKGFRLGSTTVGR